MNEFERAIEASSLSDKSITTYGYTYKRLFDLIGDTILSFSEKELIKELKSFDIKPMSVSSMISVIMLIRKHNDLSNDELIKYRTKLVDNHYENKIVSNETLKDELPSIATLTAYTNKLYGDGKYQDFMINYILLNYNTRNMDLQMKFLSNKKDADKSDNYIYATTKYLVYVRNDYKTNDKYKTLITKIYNSKMRKSFSELLGSKNSIDFIDASNLNTFIMNRTYNKLGEGRYVKSVLMEYAENGNINGFIKVSKSRPTSLEVLMRDYKIDK
tara:strand:- start:1831 stop:2646 length:816 start_codon:yes stop_codon:yes gene_type:complete